MATETHAIEIVDLRKLTIQQRNAVDKLVTGCSNRESAEAVGVDRSISDSVREAETKRAVSRQLDRRILKRFDGKGESLGVQHHQV